MSLEPSFKRVKGIRRNPMKKLKRLKPLRSKYNYMNMLKTAGGKHLK